MNNRETVLNEENFDSSVLNLYEKREKVYTRRIEGFYQKLRFFTGWPLLFAYFIFPWLEVAGRQAVYFNLPERKFHIFWMTFWPHDFGLLAWTLMIAAFFLFFITTLLGRVWCGYTCPQTVWTAIFMWMEQITEGERHQRIRLDQAPWHWEKIRKRLMKHGLWLGFAAFTGFTFIGYFYGIRDLAADLMGVEVYWVAAFWLFFFTAATYINAGWMREQVCIYMCPYARFQSAMFDRNTLIVSYDRERGEPRGPRPRNVDPASRDLGDCIDCTLCYQVCPTGIDIRDGLQYECINCANCVDACNEIMDKMGYPRGLIAYTTENMQAGLPWTWKRPKLIGYGLVLCLMFGLFSYSLLTRVPVELDVIRGRGQLFQQRVDGSIQNTYTLKILNMDEQAHRYHVLLQGLSDYQVSPDDPILLEAGEIGEVSVSVRVNPASLTQVNTPIEFIVHSENGKLRAASESRFFGPGPGGSQ